MHKCRTVIVSLLPLLFAPAPQAQEPAQGPGSALEEVIVTVRKRAQSLQDVSRSVTALSESMINDAFLTDTQELTQLVPSLNLQQGSRPRASSFNIRGVGTQSFSEGVEPSVSTVLDGVVLGRSGMAFMRLLDVERVEVLRGPQGTLFGKNSTAGVVHIITREPSEAFTASVSATAVEDDEWHAGFTVSGPLSDSLGYRLSGTYSDSAAIHGRGHAARVLPGGPPDWQDRPGPVDPGTASDLPRRQAGILRGGALLLRPAH